MLINIRDVLERHGLWNSNSLLTDFSKHIIAILPEDESSPILAHALEETLKSYSSHRVLLAKLCACFKLATKKGPTEIGVCLYSADPNLSRSVSEISKLVKAGEVLLKWPVLEDIQNPDKLATLRRVPNPLKDQIFNSGKFPDGTDFRELSCRQLREVVNKLRNGGNDRSTIVMPSHKAKTDLIRLANSIIEVSEQLSALPEYSKAHSKLKEWHTHLIEIICLFPDRVQLSMRLPDM